MKTGVVKFFKSDKGYGFITDEATGKEIFVHVSGLKEDVQEGDKVKYDEVEGRKGLNATNVTRI